MEIVKLKVISYTKKVVFSDSLKSFLNYVYMLDAENTMEIIGL